MPGSAKGLGDGLVGVGRVDNRHVVGHTRRPEMVHLGTVIIDGKYFQFRMLCVVEPVGSKLFCGAKIYFVCYEKKSALFIVLFVQSLTIIHYCYCITIILLF